MNTNTIFLVALSSVFTITFSKIIGILFEFIVRLVIVNITITSEKIVRNIDKYLVDTSKKTDICHGSSEKPINSFHIRRIGIGFIIAIRHTSRDFRIVHESYQIYGTTRAINDIIGLTPINSKDKKPYKIKVSNFESPSPMKTSFVTTDEDPFFEIPMVGQKCCIDQIKNSKKIKSILLTGEPGVGKTNIALFLAKELNAQIVFGYDLTAPGISLDNLWRLCPSEKSPVILVLDEIDGAFSCANGNKRAKNYRSLAQNKTSLNTLFDRFERTNHLIILGTSNKSFGELHHEFPSYIRKGRFDLCFTLTKNDCKLENN